MNEYKAAASTPEERPAGFGADYTERNTCRSCQSRELAEVLSLGLTYISDFVPLSAPETGPRSPLELVICQECSLVQLRHTANPDLLWKHYWYRSGTNETMRTALAEITSRAEQRVPLQKGDLVLDIGCNDGTLLRSYRPRGLQLVGFEPANNLLPEARHQTTRIINDYFNAAAFQAELGTARARVITSISMFYDLEDPNGFVEDVLSCLAPGGLWINQMNYLPAMLEQNAFDNIGHEHLEYYSLHSLQNLMERHGLTVQDAELTGLNGGSIRLYIARRSASAAVPAGAADRVVALLAREEALHLRDLAVYRQFARRVQSTAEQLAEFVRGEAGNGKRVYVYGASTRGSTLLQYAGLDHRWIAAAAERTPFKWGKKTTGTWIPIISEEQARRENPEYFLVLPWFFVEEFRRRERTYLTAGGKFIVPLPEFGILED
jgi:2-polyprenyl-3-methyl-5-hydroxy-6-metoxy-1,4-benzoquinol methylase